MLDERASCVAGAKDLLVDELLGEVFLEEGGEGGGGDVPGGEAKDFDDFAACIELGCSANWRAVCQKESAALRESGCLREQETRGSRVYFWLSWHPVEED